MNKRPNFGLSNTSTTGAFSLQTPNDAVHFSSKPFDGFKTTTNTGKKPFDLKGSKVSPNTGYGSGAMGVAAKEQALNKDIAALDWELNTITNKAGLQSEVNLKPRLFVKKKGFNDTGETRATVGIADSDWDLPANMPSKKPLIKANSNVAVIKENTVEASEWHLEKFDVKPTQGKSINVKK